MRTFFVLICSVALVCAARGETEQKQTATQAKTAQHAATHSNTTHVQHAATQTEHSASGGAHVQHVQAPQPPAAGGHPPTGGTVTRPAGPETRPETASGRSGAAKPAASAPSAPVYHYNFPTKSGLIGHDFTRALTTEQQSAIARQIEKGETGTQVRPGVALTHKTK